MFWGDIVSPLKDTGVFINPFDLIQWGNVATVSFARTALLGSLDTVKSRAVVEATSPAIACIQGRHF